MKFTFPKLRLPNWAELCALFMKTTHVGQIVSGVERQVKSLETVVEHQEQAASAAIARVFHLQNKAAAAQNSADAAKAEAERAGRVASNLTALVA